MDSLNDPNNIFGEGSEKGIIRERERAGHGGRTGNWAALSGKSVRPESQVERSSGLLRGRWSVCIYIRAP